MDLDVARLGAPEADEAGDDDDHNVDDSQADVHGEQALPQNDQEQRQRNTADGVVQAIGHMVARLLPGIGIFFGHLDLSCEIQDGECRGDQLDHIGDGGDGQTKDDGDDADDIHEGQDVGTGTALVFLAEALGQPAIITGLTDGDGVVGKAGVQGGKQSHDGAADDEEVEQPGGEDALSSEYQSGGVAVLFHAHYANACHGNANIQDAQGGYAEQQDKGDILAGILGVTAISSGHVVALGGVDEQQDCTEEAAADLAVVEGDAPAIDGKVGVAEIEDANR